MVKSKRAREAAADSVVEPTSTAQDNGSSATHEKKMKKRKRDVEEEDVAEEDPVANEKNKRSKKDKKQKKDKKSKSSDKESGKEKKEKRKNIQDLPDAEASQEDDDEDAQHPAAPQEAEARRSNGVDGGAEAKSKDEKRARKQAKREEKKQRKQEAKQGTADSTGRSNGQPSTTAAATPPPGGQAADDAGSDEDPIDLNESSASGKKDRHIVFVGNLPFSATAASISAHFASLSPVAVRCLRNRDDPNPCRGIAFVEFDKVWHMRTCLDKFHHSTFDDGVSPARKINVELTAGGGGKTKQRQQKIKEKNKKLDENRAKRIEREKQAKHEGSGADPKKGSHQEDTMHPSRRARIPGGGW